MTKLQCRQLKGSRLVSKKLGFGNVSHIRLQVEVARAWEEEFEKINTPHTRKILMRTAIVCGNEPGGVFSVLRRLVRFGLGGKMAHGRQYVSWIHEDDFSRAVEWLISNPKAKGIYNLSAPNPIPNATMMKRIRKAVGMPLGLPATRWMLEIGAFVLRTETELLIKSRRVIPERLHGEGFIHLYPRMEEALEQLLRKSNVFQAEAK